MQDRNIIERLDYILWEKDGRKSGRELDHWIEAERMVSSGMVTSTDAKPVKAKKITTNKKALTKALHK